MEKVFQIITGPMEGSTYRIEEGLPLYIGRGAKNDIVLKYDPWISSAHAIVRLQDGKIELRDLNSSNGSYILGQKITKTTFVPLTDYFVVGSTLLRVSDQIVENHFEPIGLKSEVGLELRRNSMIESAYRFAMERHATAVGSLALLMAALEEPGMEAQRFLRSLRVDLRRIAHNSEKLQIFEGEERWLNDFLRYQRKDTHLTDCYLSPLAQAILQQGPSGETIDALTLVRRLLGMEFNLAIALLGGKSVDVDPANVTEKITLSPADGDFKGLILPARFWNRLHEAIDEQATILLVGAAGTGKTSILKNCFHAMPLLDIPQLQTQNKKIFDSKVFMIFKESNDLPPYIQTMIQALEETELLAIDHFGYLLKLLEGFPNEKNSLIRAIQKRKKPVILAVEDSDQELCNSHFPQAQSILLDPFLPKIVGDVILAMVHEFELESKGKLSSDALSYLKELFGRNTNFAVLEAFLNYCVDSITGVSYVYKELMWAHRKKVVSRAFFENQWQAWCENHRLRNL